MDNLTNQFSQALHGSGLRPVTPASLLSENNQDYPEGCRREQAQPANLYYLPVSRPLTLEEIAYVVSEYGSQVLIASSVVAW